MTIFRETLSDALKDLKAGHIDLAKEILKKHEADELHEETYIESSLYQIRLYLKNYISHLYMAMEIMERKEQSQDDLIKAEGHVQKCMDNIDGFEEATKGLLKREHVLLE